MRGRRDPRRAGRDCAGLNGLIASGDRRIAEMEAEQLESLAGDR